MNVKERGICLSLVLIFLQLWSVRGLSSVSVISTTAPTKLSFSEVSIENGLLKHQQREGATSSIGERLKNGESVVELHDLANLDECRWLVQSCLKAADRAIPTRQLDKVSAAQRAAATKTPCADPLAGDVNQLLQTILQRAIAYMDQELSSLAYTLFETESLTKLLNNHELKFSSREPAINVYTEGGEFLAHKDAQALTVLLPLSCPEIDFTEGGTAFWSQDARGHRIEDPCLVSIPPAGTALLFGGCVTHAGVAVESGARVVFVASFSSAKNVAAAITNTAEQRDIYGDSM